jgi:23S rRNA pseudouridine2605 synthase
VPRRQPPRRGGRGARRDPAPRKTPEAVASGPLRLQAFLARAGVASRRASEELIRTGRVSVDGETVIELGTKVTPGKNRVMVDGRFVELAPMVWLALNKPRGYVTTRDDPEGRRTVYDLIPPDYHSLFHVGRLDRQSQGLLLLTNDGLTANRLLHPRYGTSKEYYADVEGHPDPGTLRKLTRGVELEDGPARADEVQALRTIDDLVRVRVVLREGRNREVRRMFEAIGHPVSRLLRRRFGPIELGDLAPGRWRILSPEEFGALRSVGHAQDGS